MCYKKTRDVIVTRSMKVVLLCSYLDDLRHRSHCNITQTHNTHTVTTFQSPDHMKFPDFSPTFPVEESKDYPVSSGYWHGQQSLFHINEKQGEAR